MEVAAGKAPKVLSLYLWSAFLWLAFAPVMAGQEKVRLLERGLYTSYWKLLLVTGAWCLTAALLTPPMVALVHRYPIVKPTGFKRIAAYALGSIPWVLASVCIRWILLPPLDSVTQQFTTRTLHALIGNVYLFANQIWDYLVIIVAAHAYEYFMRARNQELERAELQQALAVSELHALKSQLQPHFLFNTLQGISTLVEVDKSRAKAIILKLSSLLRSVLHRGDSDLVTVDEELKLAAAYLNIEKMRLNGRLEVRWKTEREMNRHLVPQLILQPLIENAIVHGIACSRDGGWLEIGLRRLPGRIIELCVRNSVRGKGEAGLGVGLQNTRARLKYLYGDEAALSFAIDKEGIATATVLLPVLDENQPDVANEAVAASIRDK